MGHYPHCEAPERFASVLLQFVESTALMAPESSLAPLVSGASLVCLAALGVLAARAGGAPVMKSAVRVTFWGALAMGLTAGVGAVLGTSVG